MAKRIDSGAVCVASTLHELHLHVQPTSERTRGEENVKRGGWRQRKARTWLGGHDQQTSMPESMERSDVGECPMDRRTMEGAKRRSYVIRAKSSWRKAQSTERVVVFCKYSLHGQRGRTCECDCLDLREIRHTLEETIVVLFSGGGGVKMGQGVWRG